MPNEQQVAAIRFVLRDSHVPARQDCKLLGGALSYGDSVLLMKYQSIPASFASPLASVPLADALAYANDLLAGADQLLMELADELIANLPSDLTILQRRAIVQLIHDQIDRSRAAVAEHESG